MFNRSIAIYTKTFKEDTLLCLMLYGMSSSNAYQGFFVYVDDVLILFCTVTGQFASATFVYKVKANSTVKVLGSSTSNNYTCDWILTELT